MYTDQKTIFTEAAANGVSTVADMLGLRHIELTIIMTGFTGTIKFAGSNSDTPPAFGSAAALGNEWDFVKCINQNDGSAVNGGTGLAGTATTAVYQLEVNTNAFKWIAGIISGYSAGTISVRVKGVNDSASL